MMMVGEPGGAKTKGHTYTHHVFFFPFVPVYPVQARSMRTANSKGAEAEEPLNWRIFDKEKGENEKINRKESARTRNIHTHTDFGTFVHRERKRT